MEVEGGHVSCPRGKAQPLHACKSSLGRWGKDRSSYNPCCRRLGGGVMASMLQAFREVRRRKDPTLLYHSPILKSIPLFFHVHFWPSRDSSPSLLVASLAQRARTLFSNQFGRAHSLTTMRRTNASRSCARFVGQTTWRRRTRSEFRHLLLTFPFSFDAAADCMCIHSHQNFLCLLPAFIRAQSARPALAT